MSLLLIWIRHLLLIVPALGTLLTGHVEAQGWFTLQVLIGLLLIRISEIHIPVRRFILPIELIWLSYLAYTEEGLMFLALYSSLIAIFIYSRKRQLLVMFVLLVGLAQNTVILHRDAELIWMANLIWLTISALLLAYERIAVKQHYAESLYDALARSHEDLEQTRRRMIDYAAQVERFAQAEERNRIAKDIHDDLGHRLIRQKMMMEAALQLLDKQPDKAHAMLGQIRDQMEDSMERMRRTVRRLSPVSDDTSRKYALDRLIEESGRELGIEVTFTIAGQPYPLYPSIEYVLYRNSQEAITNAVRHGGARRVDIILEYRPSDLRLSVANDGLVPDGPIVQGIGFRGMNERIMLVGGQLDVATKPHFTVTTIVPLGVQAIEA
ncbi:sensor histidine kinase [Paenibacillus mendelii]|uniref:histidine kinase n=1 Tax=Paenibacillus mendelii TaxID=206163 RepID=A0ABV6JLB2_9BACL|nr:sensor histidine kinase [Paenibacillus mendelii]MCQ6558194.1 sensor histidine kinase [Paenibacillus mendelii]